MAPSRGKTALDVRSWANKFLVKSSLVFPCEELGGAGFGSQNRSSRGFGTRRPTAHDCVIAVYKTDVRRKLVFELDLGSHSQYREPSQPKFLLG